MYVASVHYVDYRIEFISSCRYLIVLSQGCGACHDTNIVLVSDTERNI